MGPVSPTRASTSIITEISSIVITPCVTGEGTRAGNKETHKANRDTNADLYSHRGATQIHTPAH